MAKKKKGGIKTKEPIASTGTSGGTLAICDECGGGCGGCGDCERCMGIICQKCKGLGKVASLPEKEPSFASLFTTPTICVIVGANRKREYYIHRDRAIESSPYFATALAFPGVESRTNTIALDEPGVDAADAFEMVVEFIYLDDYDPPKDYQQAAICLLHTRVYVLAERLCMDKLKEIALEKAVNAFAAAYEDPSPLGGLGGGYQSPDGRPNLPTGKIVNIIETVYGFTANRYAPEEIETERDSWKGKGKKKRKEEGSGKTGERVPEGTGFTVEDGANAGEGSSSAVSMRVEEEPISAESLDGNGSANGALQEPNPFLLYQPQSVQEKPLEVKPETTHEPPRDVMRVLVAQYCASALNKYKKEKKFMDLVRRWREFAEDLIGALENGRRVQPEDLQTLKAKAANS